jgi:hypothetical protein
MGLRAGDNFVIPLCSLDHNSLHLSGDETGFLAEHGITDGRALAKSLWENTGDYSAMINALMEKRR